MRTETEMLDAISQIAKSLQVEAVALSGSRTDTKAPKDEFQDYDVVYVVDDLDNLTRNFSWLDQFGKRIIEQHVFLGHRRLYLMLFEDGNRIDLTLQVLNVFGQAQLVRQILKKSAMSFGGFPPMWLRVFVVCNFSMPLTISTEFVNKNS